MTKVKICGITRIEDALAAVDAGADMIGLNFYTRSPRYVTPERAAEIIAAVRGQWGADGGVLFVGVFVNASVEAVRAIVEGVGLDYAQLHGDESPEMVKELSGVAFRVLRPQSLEVALEEAATFAPLGPQEDYAPALLLDAYSAAGYGGTGERTDWAWAAQVAQVTPRLLLAGGLNAETVGEAIRAVRPWGVDVASGVESSPGIKNAEKVQAFVRAAKGALE